MGKKSLNTILKSWNKVRRDVEGFARKSSSSAKDVQKKVNAFIRSTEKDIKNIVDKDLPKLIKKFRTEKKAFEKIVEKTIKSEIKKATQFVNQQKGELNKLQKTIESYLPGMGKKKVSTKKKASKKKKKSKISKKKTGKKKKSASKKNRS